MKVLVDPKIIDKIKWEEFVLNHPDGNIFHTPMMFEVYKATFNYNPYILICVDSQNVIQGVLLAVIQKEYSGILGYFSSRSIIIGGPLISDKNVKALEILLKSYNRKIRKKAIYSQFRNFALQTWQKDVFNDTNCIFEDHLNIIINLKVGKEELWNNFSRSRKKGINRAQKENYQFSYTYNPAQIETFYPLLEKSYKRIKLPFPKKDHFNRIVEIFPAENFQIFSLTRNEEVVISMFCLIFKETIYGYYMGITDDIEILKTKPSDLFFWEVFKWANERDIGLFDWMGAGKPNKSYGVRDFKLQFGGDLVNFGRFEIHHSVIAYNLSLIGFNLWTRFKSTK